MKVMVVIPGAGTMDSAREYHCSFLRNYTETRLHLSELQKSKKTRELGTDCNKNIFG
jgi:hypothetical protein